MFHKALESIPTKLDSFRIAARRLNNDELLAVAATVECHCRVWLDDRRNWSSFDQFIGAIMGREIFYWQIQPDQYPFFVNQCNKLCKNIKQQYPDGDSSHNVDAYGKRI